MSIPRCDDEADARIGELSDCLDDGDFDGAMRCIADLSTYFLLSDVRTSSARSVKRVDFR